ncbi:N-acetyltransferase [Thermus sp.]|uniref:GNAT family N-acetyltransferase n=1 Tax=Thermus sp. TaxID=275 RepID=UPI00307EF8D5
MARLRPARHEDLPAIARIAHATLLLGGPGLEVFPSQALWGELFVVPYLHRGCCCLVAEVGGEVVGYILGACSRLPLLLLRLLLFPGPHAPESRFPAHLHIGVDPKAQGHGLGKALLGAFLECLRAKGVRGVQLSTTRANRAARGLYRALGFRLWAKRASPFWAPYRGRPTIHEVWVKEL